MAKVKFNANYVETMGAVLGNEGAGFSREIARILSKRTFNSVNATLAAMAKAGYLDKSKGIFEEKMLTKYTVTDAGREAYAKATAETEEEVTEEVTETEDTEEVAEVEEDAE
jgi:DNA-binding MarR family transcriptional regulator